jgi:hypothetical protein
MAGERGRKAVTAQAPTAPAKKGMEFDCGANTFLHEGRRFGPGTVTIDTGTEKEDARIVEDLAAAKSRTEAETRERMKLLRTQGIINPAPAPTHMPMEPGANTEGEEEEPEEEDTQTG